MLIINAQQTADLLSMSSCIDMMEPAMIATSGGEVLIPPRILFHLQDHSGFFANMPGASVSLQRYATKLVNYHPGNADGDLPPLQGCVAVYDHDNGKLLALIDGRVITNTRTAAASALATRLLAREDAATCGVFGAGDQARAHIEAICLVRPVERCVIWARRHEQAQKLAKECADQSSVECVAASDPADAGACDIVTTATASPEPVLFGQWVRPGAHVNLVGAHSSKTREADTELIAKSRLYADFLESTFNEGGDYLIPIDEGEVDKTAIVGEIGQLLLGKIAGRARSDEITVYNSLGVMSQDLYAAVFVLQQARRLGIGTEVDF